VKRVYKSRRSVDSPPVPRPFRHRPSVVVRRQLNGYNVRRQCRLSSVDDRVSRLRYENLVSRGHLLPTFTVTELRDIS